jgi:hypothetical protein
MPLTDVTRPITGVSKGLSQRCALRLQFDVIDKHSVGQRKLTGHDTGSRRAANWQVGYGVVETHALAGEVVERRSRYVAISVPRSRLRAPFVGNNHQHVRLTRLPPGRSPGRRDRGRRREELSARRHIKPQFASAPAAMFPRDRSPSRRAAQERGRATADRWWPASTHRAARASL